MVAGLGNLPNELLLKILSAVDGGTLVRSSRVCKRWHDVIQAILQHGQTIWEVLCMDEIDADLIKELSGKTKQRTTTVEVAAGCGPCPIDWFDLYKRWYSPKVLVNGSHQVRAYEVTAQNPVTCIKAGRTVVVTGHEDGTVCFWNVNTGEVLRVMRPHCALVTEVELVDVGPEGFYGKGGVLCDYRYVVSGSMDMSICLQPLNLMGDFPFIRQKINFGNAVLSIRSSGNLLSVMVKHNCLHLYRMGPESDGCLSLELLFYTGPVAGPASRAWLGVWDSMVRCFDGNKRLTMLKILSKAPSVEGPKFSIDSYLAPVIVANVYIQRKSTVIVLSVPQGLHISVDNGQNFVNHETNESCHARITTVALRGSLLALGQEHGWLSVYCVPAPEDLLQLDLARPSWSQQLSEAAIISVDLTHDIDGKPAAVACTSDCVLVVRWGV